MWFSSTCEISTLIYIYVICDLWLISVDLVCISRVVLCCYVLEVSHSLVCCDLWATTSSWSSPGLHHRPHLLEVDFFACSCVCSCAYLWHALLFYVLCLVFHLSRCFYVMSDVFVLSHVLSFYSSDCSQRVMLYCVLLPYMASFLIWKLPYLAVACCVACILVMRTHCLTRRMLCLPNLGIMCLVS